MTVMNELQYVIVNINNYNFALDVSLIEIVIKNNNFVRVPGSEYYFRGMINYRGDVVAVIDMGKKLFGKDFHVKEKSNNRIIMVNYEDSLCGLLTDSANEVISINLKYFFSELKLDNELLSCRKYISAAFEYEEKTVYVLDLFKLLKGD